MKSDHSSSPLTRDRILAAALELIDRHGVHAFSVRDLARTLGVYPTALYWHVPSRNALIAGAVAHALGQLRPPDVDADWRDELRKLFRRYRDAVRRHPNIAQVIGAQLVSNESLSPVLVDRLLALLENAGFRGVRLLNAYNVAIAAMVGFVTLELSPLPEDDPVQWAKAHEARLRDVSADDCPTLARHLPKFADRAFVVRWSSGTEQPLDASFEAWVAVVVEGLAVLKDA